LMHMVTVCNTFTGFHGVKPFRHGSERYTDIMGGPASLYHCRVDRWGKQSLLIAYPQQLRTYRAIFEAPYTRFMMPKPGT
jgi:hypothetical protein